MNERPDVVVLAARRSPIGKYLGALAGATAVDVGRQVAVDVVQSAGVEVDQIDHTIVGCALQAGQGMNAARQIAVRAGIPVQRPAFTVNQVCGSGLTALELGAQQIWLGSSAVVLAGGVESMSRAPFLIQRGADGAADSAAPHVDAMLEDGLIDSFERIPMGSTAERLVADLGISRQEQDAWALESQLRYRAARQRLADEICAVHVPGPRGEATVSVDEAPRGTSLEALADLRPVFQENGTVTAGNASGINDGAALAVIADRRWADVRGLEYRCALRGFHSVGTEPIMMGLAPVPAIRGLLARCGLRGDDIDLYEINEAFAGQVLGVMRQLGLDPGTVNVNGGAVALGHPIGASGCRLVVTLLHELRRRNARRGVAALCIGGGMGIAALVEAVEP